MGRGDVDRIATQPARFFDPAPDFSARIPYRVPGIISMQQNQQLVIEPGAFADSLAGEVYALAGGDYSQPLASVPDGTLRLNDTPEALEIEMRGLPESQYAMDFVSRLQGGLVRGLTAGWANQGSETTTEEIPDGSRVILRKGMLCELRYRTRSAYGDAQTISLLRPSPSPGWPSPSPAGDAGPYQERARTATPAPAARSPSLMAVTLTPLELAAAIRVGDGVTELEGTAGGDR